MILESFLNGNGVLYLWQKAKNTFVAKVEGKKLSTNDYSDEEKMKLYGIESGANKTVVSDSLTNESTTEALSAKQGKVLDDKISVINTNCVKNSQVGVAGGAASLDSNGKVPASQLPETSPVEHTHTIEDLTGLQDVLDEVSAIAAGKCDSYVFDTVDDLDAELDKSEFTSALKTGDIFYIRALDTPDYWWDAEAGKKQILETAKDDLPVLTNAEIDEIIAAVS